MQWEDAVNALALLDGTGLAVALAKKRLQSASGCHRRRSFFDADIVGHHCPVRKRAMNTDRLEAGRAPVSVQGFDNRWLDSRTVVRLDECRKLGE